jgi:ATP-dependent RNA helicase DeaD
MAPSDPSIDPTDDAPVDVSTEPNEDPSAEPRITFADLGLRSELLDELRRLGYEEPTPIQREAIPRLLDGVDLVGQAATGTGKTAAFALPILDGIDPNDAPIPTALIVVPTRELAVQVSEAMHNYCRGSKIRVVPVFGGQPIFKQLKELERGVHVVVATPGRAIDHIRRGSLQLDGIRTVVLDEADEMLDMGFMEDIEAILEATPEQRQTVLFSATMPPRIAKIAETHQNEPETVRIRTTKAETANPRIRQTVYMVLRSHKASALGRILDIESPTSAIVFCKTRTDVDELTVTMNGRGYRAEALHGGMDQNQRDRVMARLRDGTAELLVATDVAARGLDVDSLTHVVNYDVPSAPESYVHRIGRVGRAGREGVAITIAEPKQRRLLSNIERLTKQTITVAKIPTVADLRAKQVEATVAAVREGLSADDLEDFYSVYNELKGEASDRDLALAALRMVHLARGATLDEREIPDASEWKDNKGKGKGAKGKGRHDRPDRDSGRPAGQKGKRRAPSGDTGFVHINLGRKVGVRPGDLVGAIANESGLSGADIGPIRISDHYAVVGVPEGNVEDVIRSMRATSVRGKKAKVRRYVE